jgi:hypothetical protein
MKLLCFFSEVSINAVIEETSLDSEIRPILNYYASPVDLMLCINLIEISEHSCAFEI